MSKIYTTLEDPKGKTKYPRRVIYPDGTIVTYRAYNLVSHCSSRWEREQAKKRFKELSLFGKIKFLYEKYKYIRAAKKILKELKA